MTVSATAIRLVDVDPATLLVDRNLRRDEGLDKPFLDSLRQYGVLEPIVAVEVGDPDVEATLLRVRYGHRRTLGAVKVGLPSVPVFVAGREDDDVTERIVRQWVENEQRRALSAPDRLAALTQLAAFGLPAGDIAKRTHASAEEVAAALVVAGSKLAAKAVERYDFLTLDQAVAIAEFEDDKDAVKVLVASAKSGGGGFDHAAQRLRDTRDRAAALAAAKAKLVEAGVTILDTRPTASTGAKWLSALRSMRKGADRYKVMSAAEHKRCKFAAAYVSVSWNGTVETEHLCTDPKAAGHELLGGGAPAGGGTLAGKSTGSTPEEVAAEEAARAERKRVREDNAAWRSATTVRLAYLTDRLLPRTTAPKTALTYLAREVAAGDLSMTSMGGSLHIAAARLAGLMPAEDGADAGDWQARMARPKQASDALMAHAERQPALAAIAVLAAAVEAEITIKQARRPWGRYLAFLAQAGYELSEIETRLLASCAELEAAAAPPKTPAEHLGALLDEALAGERRDPTAPSDGATPDAPASAPPGEAEGLDLASEALRGE